MPQQNSFELKFIFIFENIFAGLQTTAHFIFLTEQRADLFCDQILEMKMFHAMFHAKISEEVLIWQVESLN